MEALGKRRQRLEQQERDAADELRPLIIEALREGLRPAEAQRITGWSAAYLRGLARGAGVDRARPGRVPAA